MPNLNDPRGPVGPLVQFPASEVATIADIATAAAQVKQHPEPHGRPFMVVPEGYEMESLLRPPEWPDRASGTVVMRDAPSFVRYIASIPAASTCVRRIYATLDPASFVCVLDDHAALIDNDIDEKAPQPAYREFRVDFEVPPSREWQIWTKGNKSQMSQLAFAALLEDNLPDIAEPDGGTLLEAALNFEASKAGSFRSVQRLADGSTSFEWIDETSAKAGTGRITMPPMIRLSIPVFERGKQYEMMARIRYSLRDGKLALWYELVRPHKVLEEAFLDVWATIEKDAGCGPILLGSPE